MPKTSKKQECRYKAVMLIDDNDIDNLINQKMIEVNHFAEHVYVHTSAHSALDFLRNIEKVKELTEKFLPEIIFLDINMPILDGFQFLEEFDKLSENTRSYCKVMMLSSSINPNDVDRSLRNKYISKYINKPLNAATLSAINI